MRIGANIKIFNLHSARYGAILKFRDKIYTPDILTDAKQLDIFTGAGSRSGGSGGAAETVMMSSSCEVLQLPGTLLHSLLHCYNNGGESALMSWIWLAAALCLDSSADLLLSCSSNVLMWSTNSW